MIISWSYTCARTQMTINAHTFLNKTRHIQVKWYTIISIACSSANVPDVEHIPSSLLRLSCQYTHAHAVVSCSYLTHKKTPLLNSFLNWHWSGNFFYFDTTWFQGVVRWCLDFKTSKQAKTSPFKALKREKLQRFRKVSVEKLIVLIILLLSEWKMQK